MLVQEEYNEKTMEVPQQSTARAFPLCPSCVTTTPHLNALLDNKAIQQNIMAFNNAMANIDWVSYKKQHSHHNEGSPDQSGLENAPGEPLSKSRTNNSNMSTDTQVDKAPCFLCATRRAIPLFVSLVGEAKAVRKEQAANMSKADRKALKAEVKGQMKDVKREVKKVKKELKRERW